MKNDAEKYAKEYPQQVKEGEQELKKKLAPGEARGSQPAEGSGHEGQAQPADSQPDQDAADRDSAGSR